MKARVEGIMSNIVRSGDGNAIFYIRSDEQTKFPQLWTRDITTGAEHKTFEANTFSWAGGLTGSSDGRWLAFKLEEPTPSTTSLLIVPTRGGKARRLFSVQGPEWFMTWDFTSDGKHVVIVRIDEQDQRELWTVSIETGRAEYTGLEMDGLREVSTQPNGHHVAFTAGWPSAELYVMENILPPTDNR